MNTASPPFSARLRAARIAAGQTHIGIDHPDQRQQWKIVALGDQLRADDDLERPVGDVFEFSPQSFHAAGKIRRQNQRARIRKELRDFVGQPFDSGSAGSERIGRFAFGAHIGPALHMAAMMAHERATETVLHQPCGAIGTLKAMSTGAAQGKRRIATTI